jgi:hypothetical protein
MTARKREPRAITLAEIEQQFELASYWFGTKWCPAVSTSELGYRIRVIKSRSFTGVSHGVTYDYFELDLDGTVTTAPRGWAKAYKPGRVVDIEKAVERFVDAPPNAMRIGL